MTKFTIPNDTSLIPVGSQEEINIINKIKGNKSNEEILKIIETINNHAVQIVQKIRDANNLGNNDEFKQCTSRYNQSQISGMKMLEEISEIIDSSEHLESAKKYLINLFNNKNKPNTKPTQTRIYQNYFNKPSSDIAPGFS